MTDWDEIGELAEKSQKLHDFRDAVRGLRDENKLVREALRRLHDECCIIKPTGLRMDTGPMMAPSEAAVLEARKALGTEAP